MGQFFVDLLKWENKTAEVDAETPHEAVVKAVALHPGFRAEGVECLETPEPLYWNVYGHCCGCGGALLGSDDYVVDLVAEGEFCRKCADAAIASAREVQP